MFDNEKENHLKVRHDNTIKCEVGKAVYNENHYESNFIKSIFSDMGGGGGYDPYAHSKKSKKNVHFLDKDYEMGM